jgi:hypothetical protein
MNYRAIFQIVLLRLILVQGLLPVVLTQHRSDFYHTIHIPTRHDDVASSVLSLQREDVVPDKPSKEAVLREEASALLEKAVAIRKQLPVRIHESTTSTGSVELRTSKWNVPTDDDSSKGSAGYRLYVDIGREDGTWMDPRWGASQRRIEFTIDVQFQRTTNVSQQQQQLMIQDNMGGTSSPTYSLRIASYARLRNGFDEMKCHVNGAYRIDTQNGAIKSNSCRTLRFYVTTDGKNDISYGDIHIPTGEMYFSLPCFGTNDQSAVQNLSMKDGIVSIRQIGWHTGWRRMESRIIGTFRATPIDIANQRDGF